MNEFLRLQELESFKILDSAPEAEFNELVEIASAICDTPIPLLSLIGEKRQWFKANHGLEVSEIPREHSICQHTLHNPKEVLVIEDSLIDERFKTNPLVVGSPHIRFYAGAPLETATGNVLGTLCIIDSKPRKISETQKAALMLLAKKIMNHLETRKLLLEQENMIEGNAARLNKLTNHAPGAIFQLEMTKDGKMYFPFLSSGFSDIHPGIDLQKVRKNAAIAFDVVHPDDLEMLQESLMESFNKGTIWNKEYKVISEDGKPAWHWVIAKPEKMENGTVVWYGNFQNITERKEYVNTLEQILFDISHVMRKPVANMLGLTSTIDEYDLDPETLREHVSKIKSVSEEMDRYIRKLNEVYSLRKSMVKSDISKGLQEEK